MEKILLDGEEVTEEELAERTRKALQEGKRVVLHECDMNADDASVQVRKFVTKTVLHD